MKFKLFGRLKKDTQSKAGSAAPLKSEHIRPLKDALVRVEELTRQGFSESKIIKSMKAEGYTFQDIDDALNQALRTGVAGREEYEQYNQSPQEGLPIESIDYTDDGNPGDIPAYADKGADYNISQEEYDAIEEVVEATIDSMMKQLQLSIEDINEKMQKLEESIKKIHVEIETIKSAESEKQKTALSSVEALEENISGMEPRISSLEKAFKDMVPNLVDSVREVNEMVKSFRKDDSLAD